jgi:hypothetical protein
MKKRLNTFILSVMLLSCSVIMDVGAMAYGDAQTGVKAQPASALLSEPSRATNSDIMVTLKEKQAASSEMYIGDRGLYTNSSAKDKSGPYGTATLSYRLSCKVDVNKTTKYAIKYMTRLNQLHQLAYLWVSGVPGAPIVLG